MISKKIISIVASAMIFCFMVCTSVTGVKADDSEVKVVDGSYLTSADSSTGYTPKSDERGEHLMDGECSITKAGTKRIYRDFIKWYFKKKQLVNTCIQVVC